MSAAVADLGLALQSAEGVPATAPTHRIRLISSSFRPTRVVAENPELRSARLAGEGYVSTISASGIVEAWARPSWIGLLLHAALGPIFQASTDWVDGSADPWTHVIEGPGGTVGLSATGGPRFLTIWRNLSDVLFEQFEDVRLAGLVLASRAGQPIRVTIDLFALATKVRTSIIGSGVPVEGGPPFLHRHGRGALLVEGVGVSAVDEWTLTLRTGARRVDAGAPRSRDERASITLTTGQTVTSGATWKRFHYGSATPSDSAPAGGVVVVPTGGLDFLLTLSATRSLRLQLPYVEVADVGGFMPSPGGGALRQTVAYRVVVPPRPGGHWQLQEVGASAIAWDEINDFFGSYVDSPSLGVAGPLPNMRAADLNGTSQYVSIPAGGIGRFNYGDNVGIAAWIKLDAVTSASPRTIVSKGEGAYSLRVNTAGRLEFVKADVAVIVASSTILTTGWHRVIGTKAGATTKLWIDAVDRTGTVTNATLVNSARDLLIGADVIPSTGLFREFFAGLISDVKVWTGAVTPAQDVGAPVRATLQNGVASY